METGKAKKWNLLMVKEQRTETCDSFDTALDRAKTILGYDSPVTDGLKIIEAPFKQLDYDHTLLLLHKDNVIGTIYEYQDNEDIRPCFRCYDIENGKENYILYRSFNIFSGKLDSCRHKFYSFSELYDYLNRNNGFKESNIMIGKLDDDIRIDGWMQNCAYGVYHIAADGCIAILGFFVAFGDISAIGAYKDISSHTSVSRERTTEQVKEPVTQQKEFEPSPVQLEINKLRKCVVFNPKNGARDLAHFHKWIKQEALIEYITGPSDKRGTLDTIAIRCIKFIDV